MHNLKEFVTLKGEIILYTGKPDFDKLETLSLGAGDLWHSSFEQGYKNAFRELVYQAGVYIYLNDFDGLDECVSWRINPNAFAIRKEVWEVMGGFDNDYQNTQMAALAFGYNALRNSGAIPLYIKALFAENVCEKVTISAKDRYVFFRKNFKIDHSVFMLYRMGFWKQSELKAFLYAKKNFKQNSQKAVVKPRLLNNQVEGNPLVSYIIPTMMRQDFAIQLLDDLANQTYPLSQVIVVDATPENVRNESLYKQKIYPFELILKWQETKGSCRARNEAIALCTGDYIVFGDDDIRIQPNFIEDHIKILQTYKAGASDGLDVTADNQKQGLPDLENKLKKIDKNRWKVGISQTFNNANTCVRAENVRKLIGNDVNFDGGYGEDSDFGLSLAKLGVVIVSNPFSANLHLKPPVGGYRFWGAQAKVLGKKRKIQPWELDTPVKWIKPVPSPTIMYGIVKQFSPAQVKEYKHKYFMLYLFKGSKAGFVFRLLRIPFKNLQFKKSLFYAKKLNALGIRHK
jgi:glycosyltransferase involved in cell wall biosynthesis